MRRPLPSDLEAALRRAQQVEAAADTQYRLRYAIDATARLLAGAMVVGWTSVELASTMDLAPRSVRERVRLAVRPDHLGVDITPPGPPATHRPPQLPLDQREWLTRREACQLADVTDGAITHWLQAGLLPNTVITPGARYRYLRGDIQRVLSFRDHGNRNVRRARVLAAMAADPRSPMERIGPTR